MALRLGAQTLTIEPQGQPNVQVNFNVVRNAPGLFQQSINGQAFALAYHADGSAVTSAAPAQVGETITIYGTGFGPTNPARLEGLRASGVAGLQHRGRGHCSGGERHGARNGGVCAGGQRRDRRGAVRNDRPGDFGDQRER